MADLRPALRLASEVSFVKTVDAGEGISYGHRHRLARTSTVATVPIGYADGVFRSLPLAGQEVLVHGERRPIVGVVTMDQLMVDCGPRADVRPGDEVVLLGGQGGERIAPDEWAARLGTIAYEVVCAIGSRVTRRYR
jgi:alanine racemase